MREDGEYFFYEDSGYEIEPQKLPTPEEFVAQEIEFERLRDLSADGYSTAQGSHERLSRIHSREKRFCKWGNRESKRTAKSHRWRHVLSTGWKRKTRRSKQWQKCRYASVPQLSLRHFPIDRSEGMNATELLDAHFEWLTPAEMAEEERAFIRQYYTQL